MASRNNHLVGNGEGNLSNWSVSELISSLKSALCPKDFAKVQAAIVEREETNKRDIHLLTEEKDLLSGKIEADRLENRKLEAELKKSKKECEENRDEMVKLQKEIKVSREREKSSEERCKRLMEEIKRNGEKEKEMIDLKLKSYDFESEINRLKEEIDSLKERERISKGRENNLEERCKNLAQEVKEREKDIVDMKNTNLELEGEKDKAVSEKEILMKNFQELDRRMLNLESEFQLLINQGGLNEEGTGGENTNSQVMGVKCDKTLKVEKIFGPSCDSPVKANGNPQNAGSGKHPSQNIVEISDGDDDCTPIETPCEKVMILQSEQIDAENRSETLKRKYSSVINLNEGEIGDDDKHLLSRPLKIKYCEARLSRNECPLSHCLKTTISAEGVVVNEGFTPTVESFTVSRECEKQSESEHKSQNIMNGFPLDGLSFMEESSCSSDSDSDDDNDGILFNHSQLATEVQGENQK